MASTYTMLQYKGFARTKLNRTAYDSTKLTQFIDEANKEICNAEIWRFMERNFIGTIDNSHSQYNFPVADLQAIYDIVVTSPDANVIYPEFVPHEIFRQRYPSQAATVLAPAPPTVWTSFGNTFKVGPAFPDQTYTISFDYVLSPTNLIGASDSATIDVPDDMYELVTLGVYRRALQASDNYFPALLVGQEWEDKLGKMIERYQSRQFGKPLRMGNGRNPSDTADITDGFGL